MKAICPQGHEMRHGRDVVDRKGRVVEAVWVCNYCKTTVHVRGDGTKNVVTEKPQRWLFSPEET